MVFDTKNHKQYDNISSISVFDRLEGVTLLPYPKLPKTITNVGLPILRNLELIALN